MTENIGANRFVQAARSADITQPQETQVYSQLIDIVERLPENQRVIMDFGEQQNELQSVLDNLGIGKVEDPLNNIVEAIVTHGQVTSFIGFGEDQRGYKLQELLEHLPITDTLQALAALNLEESKYRISLPDTAAVIRYRMPGTTGLILSASCFIRSEVYFPEWDFEHGIGVVRHGQPVEKALWFGGLSFRSEDENELDIPKMPGKHFRLELYKYNQPLKTYILGGLAVGRSVGSVDFTPRKLVGDLDLPDYIPKVTSKPNPLKIPQNIILGED